MKKAYIIGIAGGTGSGKTTLTKAITNHFPNDVSVIYHDNYYKTSIAVPKEERKNINFDHPNAFETELLLKHLKSLKWGKQIESPIYDYHTHTRLPKTQTIHSARVIIVEGILIFENKLLCASMDLKIFVDTDADVRIIRRILRDVKERGRSLDNVVEQYLSTVKPMHEQFVEPSKRMADIIVPVGGYNKVAIDMIISKISKELAED